MTSNRSGRQARLCTRRRRFSPIEAYPVWDEIILSQDGGRP